MLLHVTTFSKHGAKLTSLLALLHVGIGIWREMTAVGESSACECPICFLLLTRGRNPMSLPCGHTICRLCLDELTIKSEQDEFTCPLCRKVIHAQSVSLNVTLKKLIGMLIFVPHYTSGASMKLASHLN